MAVLGVGLVQVGLITSYISLNQILFTISAILIVIAISIPVFAIVGMQGLGTFVLIMYGTVFLGKVAWNFIASNLLGLPKMQQLISSLVGMEISCLPVLIPAIILFVISALITVQLYENKDF